MMDELAGYLNILIPSTGRFWLMVAANSFGLWVLILLVAALIRGRKRKLRY